LPQVTDNQNIKQVRVTQDLAGTKILNPWPIISRQGYSKGDIGAAIHSLVTISGARHPERNVQDSTDLFYYDPASFCFISKIEKPMTTKAPRQTEDEVACANCQACCCRLEVILISETGVPGHFIALDKWGGLVMARRDDGWCAALDRDTMLCTIYENRPLVCREFEAGSHECLVERAANL